jgi:transcriptional regulator with XRE-family HTH domain
MPSTHARNETVSDSQPKATIAVGAMQQRSFRGVIRESYEEEGARVLAALCSDIESTGLSDDEIEERTGVAAAQLSRIRHGAAHPPAKLLTWAIEQSRIRPAAVVVAICSVADGEFRPKPPPSVEERHAATVDVLREMGIHEVVRERVSKRLGMVKP